MKNHQLINGTNMDVDYYTPPAILNAVRDFLEGIELDPASSEIANRAVQAERFFTVADDAMNLKWMAATLWMNHPFGRAEEACTADCTKKHVHHSFPLYGNHAWIRKLHSEFADAHVGQAICITYACTSEAWFQPLMQWPQCFLSPRTNYLLPDGTVKKGVPKGSVLTYIGPYVNDFRKAFTKFGAVKV